MFVNERFTYPTCAYSESKRCQNVISWVYYFHANTKILTDFQICISAPFEELKTFNSPRGKYECNYLESECFPFLTTDHQITVHLTLQWDF